jgi:hypothetical protein
MSELGNGPKRRVFHWPKGARELVRDYCERSRTTLHRGGDVRSLLAAKLVEMSGNPRDACLRFLRQMGITQKRGYQEWTKAEQQRLLDLAISVPVEEAAKTMRRTPASLRSMLHRLEAGGRRGREWFTKSSLAAVLHIRPDEVQRWMDLGWLKCRVIDTQSVKLRIIDPDDFCDFFKQYGRQVVGRRLSYEGLRFVSNYVFPSSHAELLSVRESYKKRATNTAQIGQGAPLPSNTSQEDGDEDGFDQSAQGNSEVA